MKPKRVQFVVDAKKYFEADADRLEKAGDSDVCLVTIDFEDQRTDFIWFEPDAADPIDRNPASFPAE